MQASFNLKNRNIQVKKTHYDDLDRNGSDEYELLFKFKSRKCEIEILKVNCYIKLKIISVYSDYGFKGSKSQFCEKFNAWYKIRNKFSR